MNIYHLTQNKVYGWDIYSDCVVIANNEDEARNIHPESEGLTVVKTFKEIKDDYSWPHNPKYINVKLIGTAKYNKIKLEVKSLTSVLNPEYPSSILSVSKDTFDVFIRSVFMWNTKNAEVLSEQNKERCEKYNEEEKRWNE